MSSTANNAEVQDLVKSQLEQLLGDVTQDYSYKHNYAYIVTVVLSQIGMNRTQNNIEDKGALQTEISKGQTQFATMQQFMALLEGNTQWDSGKNQAYWPQGFTQNNATQLQNFANAFGQFFSNDSSSPNSDTSTTGKDLSIDFTLPAPFTGASGKVYPEGTSLIIDPCDNTVLYHIPGQTPSTTTDFSNVLTNVRNYINSASMYVVGTNFFSSSTSTIPITSTVPQYLAVAMANVQSQIDDGQEGFFKECFSSSSSNNLQTFAGSVEDNPLISNAEELYSNFSDSTGVDGSTVSSSILNVFNGTNGATTSLWNNMAAMMADWMQNKMQNQSSSSGAGAPAGSVYIQSNGFASNISNWYNQRSQYWDWFQGDVVNGNYPESIQIDLFAAMANYAQGNYSQASSFVQSIMNQAKDYPSAKDNSYLLANGAELINYLQNPPYANLSADGLFNSVQSSISMGSSTYQSQTQQNAAAVQQETSTLTSYDQIGQSIITAMNKSEQTIAGNLKSN